MNEERTSAAPLITPPSVTAEPQTAAQPTGAPAEAADLSPLSGVQAMRAVRDQSGMPQWAGPVAWAVLEALQTSFEHGALASSSSGLGLLQGLPQGLRPLAVSDDAATLELIARLPGRASAAGTGAEELWLTQGVAGARWNAVTAWIEPRAGYSLEHPELSRSESDLLALSRLLDEGGTLAAWLPRGQVMGADPSSLIGARAQLRGVMRAGEYELWIMTARSRKDSALLGTDRVLARQHLADWSSRAPVLELSLNGDLRQILQEAIAAAGYLARLDDSLARRLMQSLPAATRTRLQSRATRPQPWSLRRVGGGLEIFHGRWIAATQDEILELHALRRLDQMLARAMVGEVPHEEAEEAWREHGLDYGHPLRASAVLSRTRPEEIKAVWALANDKSNELQWPQEREAPTSPLERLDLLKGVEPITGEDAATVGLDVHALEAMLLADGRAYTADGWILPEIYRNAYATDLIAQLPQPQTAEQLQAVTQQQQSLEELIEEARAISPELTPFENHVPVKATQAYLNQQLVEMFSTLPFRGNELVLSRVHGEYAVSVVNGGDSSEKRRAAVRMLERYITRHGRLITEERIYNRLDRGFKHWCEEHGFFEEIEDNRMHTVWANHEWPVRAVSKQLPGWRRGRTPRPWQERSALRTRTQRRGIIGFRTGVGKTMAGIMHALDMVKQGHRAMIVVPSSVLPQWRREIELCTTVPLAVIGSRQTDTHQWVDVQNGAEIDYQLQQAIVKNSSLYLISYGAFERLRPSHESLRQLVTLMGLGEERKLTGDQAMSWDMINALVPAGGNSHDRLRVVREYTVRPRHISHANWNLYSELVACEITALPGAQTPDGHPITPEGLRSEIAQHQAMINHITGMERDEALAHADRLANHRAAVEYCRFVLSGLTLNNARMHSLNTRWDDLRVSCLVVDEVHNFKGHNVPAGQNIRYLGSTAISARAVDLFHKARLIQHRIGNLPAGTSTVGLSATVYKNSVLDIYNLLDMLAPDVWKRAGMDTPRQFIDRYCHIEHKMEKPRRGRLGKGEQLVLDNVPVKVLMRFKNVRELRQLAMPYIDLVRPEDVNLKVPESSPTYQIYPATKAAIEVIRTVASEPDVALATWGGKQELLQITDKRERLAEALLNSQGLMRITQRAELDLEMIDPVKWRGDVSPKVAGLLEEVANLVGAGIKTLIFCDTVNMFNPEDAESPNPNGYTFHDKLKRLICERTGLPESQVGIINGVATPLPEQRHAVAERLNDGRMAVVIGNGDVMGESLNLQEEVGAIQNLDLPANPAGIEQRQGRVIRQGNELERVQETYHMGSRGQDTYMMDLMRGKRGLYDQIWMGTDDVVDNPERAMIPTADQLELLSIDDDAERAQRAAELLEREEQRLRLEKRRSWLGMIYQIGEHARYQREVKRVETQLRAQAQAEYDREVAEIAAKQAAEVQAGRKPRHRVPKTQLERLAPGAMTARLARLQRTRAIAIEQLKLERFPDIEALEREDVDKLLYLPAHNTLLDQHDFLLIPNRVLGLAHVSADEPQAPEQDGEDDPEALLERIHRASKGQQQVAETRAALSNWSVGRLESVADLHIEVEMMSGPNKGQLERIDIYDLMHMSKVLPNLAARLLLVEDAKIRMQPHLLADVPMTPAHIVRAALLAQQCREVFPLQLIVRDDQGTLQLAECDDHGTVQSGQVVTGEVSLQDLTRARALNPELAALQVLHTL